MTSALAWAALYLPLLELGYRAPWRDPTYDGARVVVAVLLAAGAAVAGGFVVGGLFAAIVWGIFRIFGRKPPMHGGAQRRWRIVMIVAVLATIVALLGDIAPPSP